MRGLAFFSLVVLATLLGLFVFRSTTSPRAQNAAQRELGGASLKNAVGVQFVGCKSDGQSGPMKPPSGKAKLMYLTPQAAQLLAYYSSAKDFGVLAPRGWYCSGVYGSDGNRLYIGPQPISMEILLSQQGTAFSGPIVELSLTSGETSGRFEVARTIARVFPKHLDFVAHVVREGTETATSLPSGPYPSDKLIYINDEVVEYETPPLTEGLGIGQFTHINRDPVKGVVMLTSQNTDLVRLSVRQPSGQDDFSQVIIQQLELDIAAQAKRSSPATNQTRAAVPARSQSESAMGYPVPEKDFVAAYVLANIGRDGLDEAQLVLRPRNTLT